MSVSSELLELETNRANIVAAINSKGGSLGSNAGLAACPSGIQNIQTKGHPDVALEYIETDGNCFYPTQIRIEEDGDTISGEFMITSSISGFLFGTTTADRGLLPKWVSSAMWVGNTPGLYYGGINGTDALNWLVQFTSAQNPMNVKIPFSCTYNTDNGTTTLYGMTKTVAVQSSYRKLRSQMGLFARYIVNSKSYVNNLGAGVRVYSFDLTHGSTNKIQYRPYLHWNDVTNQYEAVFRDELSGHYIYNIGAGTPSYATK